FPELPALGSRSNRAYAMVPLTQGRHAKSKIGPEKLRELFMRVSLYPPTRTANQSHAYESRTEAGTAYARARSSKERNHGREEACHASERSNDRRRQDRQPQSDNLRCRTPYGADRRRGAAGRRERQVGRHDH